MLIHHKTVAVQNLLPAVLGEIDIGRYPVTVCYGSLIGFLPFLNLGNDVLQFTEHIISQLTVSCCLRLLSGLSLVVEAVAAVLEFARFDPAVRSVGHHWRTAHIE